MDNKIIINDIICNDCESVLKGYPDNFFDLIITSPPYADSRKKHMAALTLMNMLNGSYQNQKNF